jgi:hypothetical protein
VRKDGTRFYVEVSSSNVTSDIGNVVGAMASLVDTQRSIMVSTNADTT